MVFEVLTKVYGVSTVNRGSSENRAWCHWMSGSFKKDKLASEPSMLSLIIYRAQDKPFKRNRGFVVGTGVEI